MAVTFSWRAACAFLLAVLPWLNPFTGGPSPSVVPWLVSMTCGIALCALALASATPPRLPTALLWSCVALVLWALLTHRPVRPETAMLAGGLALIVLAAWFAREPQLAGALQAALLVAAAVSAVLGLLQYFGLSAALDPTVNRTDAGQAYANLRQTNQFATLCWIGAAVILFGMPKLPWAAAAPLLVLLATGAAASASRTSVLEGAVVLLLAAIWRATLDRQRLMLCAVTTVAFVVATAFLPQVLQMTAGTELERTLWARLGGADACFSRWIIWRNVLQLAGMKPLAGWGWGELDYAHYMTLYAGPRFCDILDNAHNLPLHLAVELGWPVALLACGLALWWALRRRPWRETDTRRQLAWGVLALLLLHSLVEYPLWYGPFQIACGVAVGWLLGPAPQPAAGRTRWPAAVALGALLAGTAYAAWDYARVSQIYLQPEERWPPWRQDALERAGGSWLFSGQARFAALTLATPSRGNADWMYPLAEEVLHYSPEPRVIERVIESAALAGRNDEALLHLVRFRAAFPSEYAQWRALQRQPPPP